MHAFILTISNAYNIPVLSLGIQQQTGQVQLLSVEPWVPGGPSSHSSLGFLDVSRFLGLCQVLVLAPCIMWDLSLWHTVLVSLKPLGILNPWLGIRPTSPTLQRQTLNHWTARKVPLTLLFMQNSMFFYLYIQIQSWLFSKSTLNATVSMNPSCVGTNLSLSSHIKLTVPLMAFV